MSQENNNDEPLQSESKSKEKYVNIFKKGLIWRPVPTILTTTLCLLITGIIFLTIGIIVLILSKEIKEFKIRYDNNEDCDNALSNKESNECTLTINLQSDFKKTIMVYYQLENFYQNHRRYIKSRSINQLKGKRLTKSQIKDDCDPILTNEDLGRLKSVGGIDLVPSKPANPCGLIAKSFFNDTFKLYKNNEEIKIESNGIAWKNDIKRFKRAENYQKIQWIDVEDERFIVWMRPAGLPTFRKLWGKINQKLSKGEYKLVISNNYPVKSFKGKKSFVLSTVNSLGGKNDFLGIAYIVVGAFSIVMSAVFWFGYKRYNSDKKIKLE